MYGNGDAVIGINPATDSTRSGDDADRNAAMRSSRRYDIPTQSCVLTHVTTSIEAIKRGAPVDLVFQSIAGTEAANSSFGINLAMLSEGHDGGARPSARDRRQQRHVLRDRPGQRALGQRASRRRSADLEARAYAVARKFQPLLVNTVVGFIGPEYLYDGKQIIRAGLEDHFCGKLLGVPMGCDICYTNHAEADQNDMDMLLTLLGAAGMHTTSWAFRARTTSCSTTRPRRSTTRSTRARCWD